MFYDKFSVEGKKVFITGGSQGIGKCVAGHLAQCGALTGIVDINFEKAKKTAQEIGKGAFAISCDVTVPEQVDNAVDEFVSHFGGLDAVFNNAGIVIHKPAIDLTPEEFRRVMDVNLNGVFYVAQATAKALIKQGNGGSIVNTASMSAHIVNIPQCQASYNASKAAVVHLTKSLAVEWVDNGIRVNCISPGYIATELIADVQTDWIEHWKGMIPYRRLGTPEELVGAIIYLMSDASPYTSGTDIIIDGCFTCL